MIILLGALVVLVAAVVLVIGMVTGAFSLVYAGLGLAAAGVVLLLLLARFLGRSGTATPSEEPAPLTVTPSDASPETEAPAEALDAAFPIARYDSLWVTQIVPQLAGLSPYELALVDARERGGRHRAGVLDAITAAGRGEAPAPPDVAITVRRP